MPKIISLDDLEDGMVVKEPVVNNFGQVLIGSGAALNPKQINLLKLWNITSVLIHSDEDENDEFVYNEDILSQAKIQLLERMKWEPRNMFEEEIFQMGLLHKYKTLAQQK